MSHDAAARQLSWPLGTVKGRLARARDLLRTRLARRGVALTGGGLAAALAQSTAVGKVPAALLGMTLRQAVSFAGGETLAAGAVSTQAVKLAKGALQTMTATKLVLVLLLLGAAGGIGTATGLFLYRASGGEGPRDQPLPQAARAPIPPPVPAREDFGPEVKGLRAKVSLVKNKVEVGAAVLAAYVVKNVSREEQTLWHSGFWPNHLIVVKDADGKEPPLTEHGKERRRVFSPGGERLRNVAVKVPAGGEDAAYEKYDLTRHYDLSRPGRYTVQYVYEEKQGGWEGRLPSNEAAFEIVAVKEDRQNVIEKDGVRFEILVPDRDWPIPENRDGARAPIKLGLRITNKTDKPLRFTRFDTLFPEMTGPNGKPLSRSGGRNETLPMKESDCPLVKPGERVTFDIDAHLFWQGGKLRFGGSDGFGGVWGFADELKPGRYRLRIWYVNTATEHEVGRAERTVLKGIWTGEVKTPFVEVSLTPRAAAREQKDDNMAESEAVRVQGLSFVALVPKGVSRLGEVDLGLRVTNVSDKPVALSVNDVISIRLVSLAGERTGMNRGRDGLPRPKPPVMLQPGDSWRWRSGARLVRAGGDRSTIQLEGPDGRGVAGFWWFAAMKEGKYRLSIEYANSNARQGEVALWVGKATTKEVEFEIGPGANREPGEKPAVKPAEEAVKGDLKKLQGTWRLVAIEEAGQAVPPANFGQNTHWVFSGTTGTFTSGKRVLTGTITLDSAKRPRWIDVTHGTDLVLQGIYELKGDRLRLFLVPAGARRPGEFKTEKGTQQSISTYERARTDPK
jgi:uncharacterized protein (TIGR03067 family)